MQQYIVFAVIGVTLVLFISNRWRYDVVALIALLSLTLAGVIPAEQAFSGFSSQVVITVAAVLVVSRGLMNSGVVDQMTKILLRVGKRPTLQLSALSSTVAAMSGFLSSVAALALLMPVAIRMARSAERPPSILLMPLAFAALLGAMITLIGSAPNLIIATFRAETGAEAFRMFDYTPVGIVVALAGVTFITLIGWRLIPQRKGQIAAEDLFRIEEYMTEMRIPVGSKLVGRRVRDLEATAESVTVAGLVRGDRRLPAPSSFEVLREGDIIVLEADPADLTTVSDSFGLEMHGSKDMGEDLLDSEEVTVMEVVVKANSMLVGRTPRSLSLRWRYGLNLLAAARHGARIRQRLSRMTFRPGDVLLLQGQTDTVQESIGTLGLLPLAGRGLQVRQTKRIAQSLAIFAAALLVTAFGVLEVHVAFSVAAVVMVLARLLTVRDAYDAIDGSVLVLLGAMIPVGQALEASGGATLIADGLLQAASALPPAATLAIILVGTMTLSDLINNGAAAVLMAPIAIGVAEGIGASVDPFLMAVAVGASCAFLTPISHHTNALVFGPGGYRFGDYWRLGLPLEIVVAATGVPMIMRVWPLGV